MSLAPRTRRAQWGHWYPKLIWVSKRKESERTRKNRKEMYTIACLLLVFEVEWRHGRGGHLILQDEDLTTKLSHGCQKINTLAHYGIHDSAVMSLVSKKRRYGTNGWFPSLLRKTSVRRFFFFRTEVQLVPAENRSITAIDEAQSTIRHKNIQCTMGSEREVSLPAHCPAPISFFRPNCILSFFPSLESFDCSPWLAISVLCSKVNSQAFYFTMQFTVFHPSKIVSFLFARILRPLWGHYRTGIYTETNNKQPNNTICRWT